MCYLRVESDKHLLYPKGESEENLEMMQKIDAEHMDHPAKSDVGMTDSFWMKGTRWD